MLPPQSPLAKYSPVGLNSRAEIIFAMKRETERDKKKDRERLRSNKFKKKERKREEEQDLH